MERERGQRERERKTEWGKREIMIMKIMKVETSTHIYTFLVPLSLRLTFILSLCHRDLVQHTLKPSLFFQCVVKRETDRHTCRQTDTQTDP